MQNGYANVQRATRNKRKVNTIEKPSNIKEPDRTDKLICKPCLKLGYSPRDTSPYKCDGCGQARGHTAYPQKGVRCCEECLKTKARCSKCNEWKNIAAEKWEADEVHSTKISKLLCVPCRASGITKRSTDLFECVGCAYHTRGKVELGREHFEKKVLNNAKTQGNPLVCLRCKAREDSILEKLDTLKNRGTCPCTSTWRHEAGCKFLRKNRVRISENDLKWMLFRKKNYVARVQEIEYYRDLGVLIA